MRTQKKKILIPHTSGLPAHKDVPTLILVAGFPDTATSWSRLSKHFEETHHIIALHLPDYEKEKLSSDHFWGYSFDEISSGLLEVIKPHYDAGSKIHLVGHDWGSLYAQILESKYPNLLHKLILLDVGKVKFTELSLKAIKSNILILMYQIWLAFAFLISRVTETIALIWILSYPWDFIGPVPYDIDTPLPKSEIKPFTCYPYFQVFFGKHNIIEVSESYETQVPVQFLYGDKKRVMFHSDSYIQYLQSRSDCRYKCFSEDGHWFNWTSPDALAKEMKEFLSL